MARAAENLKGTFERAKAQAARRDLDALTRGEAQHATTACDMQASDLLVQPAFKAAATTIRVETSDGTMSVADIRAKCKALRADVDKLAVPGCGYRRVDFESMSLGGGAWSPANVVDGDDWYIATKCDQMPAAPRVPAELRGLVAKASQRCGRSPRIGFDSDGWEVVPLRTGQVKRQATAVCWTQGTYSDWGGTGR